MLLKVQMQIKRINNHCEQMEKMIEKTVIGIIKRKKMDLVQNGSCLKTSIHFGFIRTDAIYKGIDSPQCRLLLVVTCSVCPLQDIKPPF